MTSSSNSINFDVSGKHYKTRVTCTPEHRYISIFPQNKESPAQSLCDRKKEMNARDQAENACSKITKIN
jgi:hypothetical protein